MAGGVTISIEIELGWGRHMISSDDKYNIISEGRTSETKTLSQLLRWCEQFGVPISFDIVGHLFHRECDCNHQAPHDQGWFNTDPGGNVESDPIFYSPDIVNMIKESTIDHEICSHTYSHILTDEVDSEVIRWELDKLEEVFASQNLPSPISIVLPQHKEVPYRILSEFDYEIVRIPVPLPHQKSLFRKNLSIVTRTIGRRHPVRSPDIFNGLVETYSTYEPSLTAPFLPRGQIRPHPAFRWLPTNVGKHLQERYLHDGVKRASDNEFAHFWTHLYNMSNQIEKTIIREFIKYLGQKRDIGDVSMFRMKDIPEVVK